jgi:hypothetical protein
MRFRNNGGTSDRCFHFQIKMCMKKLTNEPDHTGPGVKVPVMMKSWHMAKRVYFLW